MTPLLLFAVLMVITFAGFMLLIRPTKQENRIEQRLNDLSRTSEMRTTDDSIMLADHLSENEAINKVLEKYSLFTFLRRMTLQAGLSWDFGYLLLGMVTIAIVASIVAYVCIPNLVLDAILALAAAAMPLLFVYLKRAARFRRFQQYLPEAVDLMARAMRAGHPLTSAVEIISLEVPAPVGPEFRRVFEEQSLGLPIREALINMADRVPVRDLQLLVTAMLVQKETGGNLVDILEKTSTILRERVRLMGQLRIYTAQGRLTGWILCLMPFVLFAMLAVLNHSYTDILLKDPLGQKLAIAGMGLMAVGVVFIRKIIDIKV